MTNDQLFLKTINDIKDKIRSNDSYEILMVAGLLRKLLLDSSPLIHQVNKSRGIKIVFTINDRGIRSPQPLMWFIQDGFDPDTSVPHLTRRKSVNLATMLKQPVALINGNIVSVQDLIRYLSHVMGAVHAGKPKSKNEQVLQQIDDILQIGDMSANIRSILAIARVVLKGLEPLVNSAGS